MVELQPIDFTRGVPANESFPLIELSEAATAAFAQHGVAMMQYGPASGFAPLREWLAQWQNVQPNQVLTGNGSLELVEFWCRLMIQPSDVIFTESPTYDHTLTLLRRHQASIVGIPLEPDGLNISVLESELRKHVPKFSYLIPDFQNPVGATYSGAKRRRLVELAEQHGLLLVEDAQYRFLRYRSIEEPTLLALSPHHPLSMSSFTSCPAPASA